MNDEPVLVPISPNQTAPNMSEGDSLKFKVSVSDKETPANQLKINWTLDGVKVSSLAEYEFIANYDTVVGMPYRQFQVRVTVSDGLATVGWNWTVTVQNVNRQPRDARITFPSDGQVYDEGAKVHLMGAGADDDGDNLTFQWYDGTKLLGSGQDLYTSKLKPGKHNITLTISDGLSSDSTTITVKVNAKKSPASKPRW